MTISAFTHSLDILQGLDATRGRVARKVRWIVWVIGHDASAFELDAEGPAHAARLAETWTRAEVGLGRVARAEVRMVDPTGATHLFGKVQPWGPVEAPHLPALQAH